MDVLNQYIKKWNLSDASLIAKTQTSNVYRAHQNGVHVVLKILTPVGEKFEEVSAEVLKCYDGNGAVRILESDAKALLLEYIEGQKLSVKVENGQDIEASEAICTVLEKLHSYSGPIPKTMHSLQQQFKSVFDRAKIQGTPDIYIRTAKVAQELIETEKNKVLLHGDIHHTNILKSKRGWVAIDPQAFYGERTYDLANAFFNPDYLPEIVETKDRILLMATIFSEKLNIDKNRILKFAYAHGGLSSSWQLDDGKNPERRLRITSLIESLI